MKKLLILFVLLIFALIGGGVYYLHSNLDSLLKSAIEKYGSEATQTSVGLDNVHIALTTGEGSLDGLTVDSPKGFSSDEALHLGTISMALDINSIKGSGPIVIKQVKIDQPRITYELDTLGNSNLQALTRNAQAYAAAMARGQKSESKGRKVIINNMVITNGEITIIQPLLQGKILSAPLPTLRLTDIGRNNNGATAAQIAQQLLTVITVEVVRVASKVLLDPVGTTEGIVKGGAGLMKGAVEGGAEAVDQQLKGLLGQ